MFSYFWCQTSPVSPRAPDPDRVRIWPDSDPGWFSEPSTSMVRLTLKVWKQKRRLLKLSNISFDRLLKSPFVWGKEPRIFFFGQNRILIPAQKYSVVLYCHLADFFFATVIQQYSTKLNEWRWLCDFSMHLIIHSDKIYN